MSGTWVDVTEIGSEFRIEMDVESGRRRVVGPWHFSGATITFDPPILLPKDIQTREEIRALVRRVTAQTD